MEITLALDWTPNTNHTGFYVAQAQGMYKRLGVEARFLSPAETEDTMAPAARVASGEAMLGICPSEALMAYHVAPEAPRLVAVAAILQRDTSALVATERSGCTCPAQLDGRTYAAYNMPLELDIVGHMIRHDGGRGDFDEVTPPLLSVPDAVLEGIADMTWIFMGWEGIQFQRRGVGLNVFKLKDYGVPYGYAPVLVAHPDMLRKYGDEMCSFVQGSALGFEFAAHDPDNAAGILMETAQHPDLADVEFVLSSQRFLSREYLTRDGRWGVMASMRWQAFWDWVTEQHLFKDSLGRDVHRNAVSVSGMFTNQFLL